MFQTFDHAKIFLPLSNPDESAWAYAELMVNAPWFFADCQITEDDISIQSSYILSNPIQLNELSYNSSVLIKGVYMLSPPHINLTDTWKMEKIRQVSIGATGGGDCKVQVSIYELLNGGRYYSTELTRKNNIKNIKIIFSLSGH